MKKENYIMTKKLLKYEGEFLNGKKNGKGVEYGRLSNIKYVGEFLGKKNGKIKEYVLMAIFITSI